MGAYSYQALKSSGGQSKGVIEADSPRHARQLLRKQGLIPTDVIPFKGKSSGTKRRDFKSKDLTLFTRQLATLIGAGIPLDEALQGVADQTIKKSANELIKGVRSKVLEGFSLAQALGEYPRVFPELYRATVGSGEQTGKLDSVLEDLANYTEHQQNTQQKIQQALLYPSLMLIISITIISFLLAFVVPKIVDVFAETGEQLPTATHILIGLSHGLKRYGLYILFTLFGFVFGLKRAIKRPNIRKKWHQILLKLPGIRHMIVTTNIARFTHTFAILFAAGVSVIETMRVSASLMHHIPMREAFETATIRVKEGMAIHKALAQTHFFTPMATHLISSGEKSGQISSMMARVARYLDSEVRRLIDTGLTLLEPLVILLMGGMILFIVLATLLPIFSMEQLVA